MACKNVCQLCKNLVISQSITFTGGNLVVNLPAGSYENCRKICVILAQAIPAETTVSAPVVFTIGSGPVQYPLVNRCCRPVLAKAIRTRYKYSTCVETTTDTGVFKLLGNLPCYSDNLRAINGDGTPVAATPAAGA